MICSLFRLNGKILLHSTIYILQARANFDVAELWLFHHIRCGKTTLVRWISWMDICISFFSPEICLKSFEPFILQQIKALGCECVCACVSWQWILSFTSAVDKTSVNSLLPKKRVKRAGEWREFWEQREKDRREEKKCENLKSVALRNKILGFIFISCVGTWICSEELHPKFWRSSFSLPPAV